MVIEETGLYLNAYGTVDINHRNLYNELLSLLLGRYRVPHAEANGTE